MLDPSDNLDGSTAEVRRRFGDRLLLALIGSDRRPSDFQLFMEDLPCLDGARFSWLGSIDKTTLPITTSEISKRLGVGEVACLRGKRRLWMFQGAVRSSAGELF
jgi:hypothetical protein